MQRSKSEKGVPAIEDIVEQVADDVYRVTVPVPFRGLGTVNCYLLRGEDGWDLVDTGLGTRDALDAWRQAWDALGTSLAEVRRIVLTHHHPDHIGLAGRFQQEAHEQQGRPVPVLLSPREIEVTRLIWDDREGRNDVMEAYFARCGLPDPAAANFSTRETEGMKRILSPFPEAFVPLPEGEGIRLGARTFQPILTPGHSDGHLVFFDAEDGLLLAGDHVLPHITPNIALWPGADPDPLGHYLEALGRLYRLDVRRALPGHGSVITNWRERVAELESHHEERLQAMRTAVGSGATVFQVAREVFAYDTLDRHQARMAIAETLAHLEHLALRGRLHRTEREAWWFEPA